MMSERTDLRPARMNGGRSYHGRAGGNAGGGPARDTCAEKPTGDRAQTLEFGVRARPVPRNCARPSPRRKSLQASDLSRQTLQTRAS